MTPTETTLVVEAMKAYPPGVRADAWGFDVMDAAPEGKNPIAPRMFSIRELEQFG